MILLVDLFFKSILTLLDNIDEKYTILRIMNIAVLTDIAVFIVFIIAVVFVGLYKSRGEDGSEGYFLAGRGLSWWLIGISLIAANISTEQFVGMSGSASGISGLAIASYEWMAAITLVFVAFLFLPKFLKCGIYTVPQFLEYRLDSLSRSVMSFMMVIVLVLVNITAVIYSGATVAETVFGSSEGLPFEINLEVSCWAIGMIAAVYVCSGGLKACAWADLLQGTALIIGGTLIAYFAFDAFAAKPVAEIATTATFTPQALDSIKDAGTIEKFFFLNYDKLTMFMPADHSEIPWTALIIGLWIPNFYYWGFNQYIIQRTLGASSLAEGQKGIILAASLKLIIPFIIVIPGIMAFNLFSNEQAQMAQLDKKMSTENAKAYSSIYFSTLDSAKLPYDVNKAVEVFKDAKGNKIFTVADMDALYKTYQANKASGALEKTQYTYDKGWAKANPNLKVLVDAWNKKHEANFTAKDAKKQALYGYKYDSAFGLLITKVLPDGFGLRGFIFAALLGAVVSSLAAMLNAASTIFTIDIYKKFIAKNASEKNMVLIGRIVVLIFAVIGCLVAPVLANPNLGTIFVYIQEFQGFLSPGILAVFIFGMFSKKAPRFSGALGILTSPIVYGFLKLCYGDIAFLNRMAITFACSLAVMYILTLVKPLKQEVEMPENTSIDLSSSKGAKLAGIAVLTLCVILYVVFSGLFFTAPQI